MCEQAHNGARTLAEWAQFCFMQKYLKAYFFSVLILGTMLLSLVTNSLYTYGRTWIPELSCFELPSSVMCCITTNNSVSIFLQTKEEHWWLHKLRQDNGISKHGRQHILINVLIFLSCGIPMVSCEYSLRVGSRRENDALISMFG